MSRPSSAFNDLLGLAYDTAIEPGQWLTFLSALSDSLRGTLATLLYHDAAGQGAVAVATRAEPEGIKTYSEYYGALDPWARAVALRGYRVGEVNIGDWLISHEDLKKTEYYNDFASRLGIVRCLGATVELQGPLASTVSVMRSERGRPFGSDDRNLLLLLVPHLRRVLAIDRKIGELGGSKASAEQALDRLPNAVALLSPSGRVTFLNALARTVIEQGDGLSLGPRGLVAASAEDGRRLAAAVRAAGAPRAQLDVPPWIVLTVSRPSMRRPYVLTVMRLRGHELVQRNRAGSAVAVFIHDPELKLPANEEMLQRAYGLTPAEARVAADVASGVQLTESARRGGVAISTTRWHLKNVFDKTGARSQAELVTLLARHPVAQGQRGAPQGSQP